MANITYLTGDATRPTGEGTKFICHICNDIGGWGRGFVTAISKRWPEPEQAYRQLYKNNMAVLGAVQTVSVETDIVIANLVAQRDIRPHDGVPPIRYDALRESLDTLLTFVNDPVGSGLNGLLCLDVTNPSFHMPRIGCGLAGGSWDQIEPILTATLVANGYNVFVYDLP